MADIDAPLAWRMQQDGYLMQINQLRDENAKLRELCADMFKLAGEVYVPLEDAGDWMARDGDIERRMRELGIENGAEPNETVLHSRTPNGYEAWNWLPVHERIVRCRDCMSAREHCDGMDVWWCEYLRMYVGSSDFCCWGERREDG